MREWPEDFLKESAAVWQRRSTTPLTLEDARQITANLVGYFDLLARWAKEAEKTVKTCEDNGNQPIQSTLEPSS